MKFIACTISILLIGSSGLARDKEAYRIYDSKGKEAGYKKLLADAKKADVILFGELHNNPICHWLQFELTGDLHKDIGERLTLGAEMFESDNQLILSEFVKGKISANSFGEQARLWPNYRTDYQPLVEFARDNGLPFVATNVPRRYASMVYKGGFEALSDLGDEAKKWIAPLPVQYDPELESYRAILEMGGGHGGENLPKAQALKDATMAYFIIQNRGQDNQFIHFNGSYHSNNYEGIAWYLKQLDPGIKILTIAAVEQQDIGKLSEESIGLADFIICIPSSMTKTH